MGKQYGGMLQEMSAEHSVWDGDGEFLDQFLGGGKGMLSLLVTPLGLIQLSEVDGNAPQQWSQPLCMRSILRCSQHLFCFCFPMKRHEGFTAQFPEARDDTLPGDVRGRCDQPIGDVKRQARVTMDKGEVGSCSPHEPLPDRLGGIIRPEHCVEKGFGPRHLVLCNRDECKEPGYNAGPEP